MSKKIARISKKKIKIGNPQDKAYRLTKQRLAILKYLRSVSIHPTAVFIYKEIKKEFPRISFGTVYRNLNFLQEHGYIKEFIVNKVSHFDCRVDSHVHMVCENCHSIFDLDDKQQIYQLKYLAEKNKFYIRYENFQFWGYCQKCKKKLLPKKHIPELFCMACGHLVDDLEKEETVCKECKFKVECAYTK